MCLQLLASYSFGFQKRSKFNDRMTLLETRWEIEPLFCDITIIETESTDKSVYCNTQLSSPL